MENIYADFSAVKMSDLIFTPELFSIPACLPQFQNPEFEIAAPVRPETGDGFIRKNLSILPL